jgi:hypothetical protein
MMEKAMNRTRLLCIALLIVSAAYVTAAAQSGQLYEDVVDKFSIKMIGDWRAVSYSDAAGRQKTDFVYRDRSEGLLRISKESMGSKTVSDFAHDIEEEMRVSHQGFESASTEEFGGGALQGVRLSYFYVSTGRPTAETDYFLKDGDQLWELRFTGHRGELDQDRNVTDEMARSFRPLR